MKRWIKRIFYAGIIMVIAVAITMYVSHRLVEKNAQGKVTSNAAQLSKKKVGLLLGTSKYTSRGTVNLYYKYRLEAAVRLYKAGKIDYILVSGDNGSVRYDEPTAFKKDLMKHGIPEDRIVLDYAGFRTLDSIVRAREVFGQESFIIISQPFHNERALYLANHYGIDATGYNAKEPHGRYSKKVKIREAFARVKLMMDLMVDKQPKFLGEKVIIGG